LIGQQDGRAKREGPFFAICLIIGGDYRAGAETHRPQSPDTPSMAPPDGSCTIEIRVRYAECDPMGVAHHTAYPVWFEMGRTELLRRGSDLPYRDLEAQGVFFAVTRLEVRYRRPARYDDVLTLQTRITGTGRAKIEHAYELYRDGELLSAAATTLVCLDREGRPQPLPDSITREPA
jgi:acyl-CoA thioester hydrolase